jgi:hypothetical protein
VRYVSFHTTCGNHNFLEIDLICVLGWGCTETPSVRQHTFSHCQVLEETFLLLVDGRQDERVL